MRDKQSLPLIWLLSDARNDAQLEQALADLPRGSLSNQISGRDCLSRILSL